MDKDEKNDSEEFDEGLNNILGELGMDQLPPVNPAPGAHSQMLSTHAEQGPGRENFDSSKEQMIRGPKAADVSQVLPLEKMDTINPNIKYQSRALKKFDDDDSQDEEDLLDSIQTEEALKYKNTQGETISQKPNARFKNYKEVFNNLLKSTSVTTMYPINSVMISYDSTRAITVTKRNDREYYVKMYDLESYELTFEEKIGGKPDSYIKLKDVE